LDEKKCISCYCCYELCPQQAVELTGLMRWITPRRNLEGNP
jgi:formate hydrogenlyase subunit 6/NADH:ubiquinone oxidoreductase subunit I